MVEAAPHGRFCRDCKWFYPPLYQGYYGTYWRGFYASWQACNGTGAQAVNPEGKPIENCDTCGGDGQEHTDG